MKNKWSWIYALIAISSITSANAQVSGEESSELRYPIKEESSSPFQFTDDSSKLYLSRPAYYDNEVTYDPERNEFIIQRKVGGRNYGAPIYKSFDEYKDEEFNQSLRNYWTQKVVESDSRKSDRFINPIRIGGQAFETIFGSNKIDIRPQGSAELMFGVIANRRDDPRLDVRQQRTANFDFQQKIQMNVTAKIGERIELKTNYNTEASFEFENKMNLNYEGDEDDILQKIELGDVTLPLPGTLISGSQSLFGIKTKWRFGKMTVTSIFSQQKSESKTIEVSGGAQTTDFEIKADEYEDNKHFFISHHFRRNYRKALEKLPIIQTNINITKIEVWVTEVGTPTGENRNIIAFQDLGEYEDDVIYREDIFPTGRFYLPENRANYLYNRVEGMSGIRDIANVNNVLTGNQFVSGVDYEFIENAKKLQPSEFYFNNKLGFISLNFTLNPDQVLAVAYQYTVIGDTTTYSVGEFSNGTVEGQQSLIVKLLKSSATNTQIPLWDLMMKNVYALGGYQINSDDFRLNILYEDDGSGLPAAYLPKGVGQGIPLIEILNLDRLNTNEELFSDGLFDFIDGAATGGGTIQSSNGRIYFPVLEPFGDDLRAWLDTNNEQSSLKERYVFDSLYSTTKYKAKEFPEKNKFLIAGRYKSSASNDISLNAMNIPQGSVTVTAGGIPLTENVDYTVDYTLGRVQIINDAYMNSGVPIRVNFESNSLFNLQTKTLVGAHFDYEVNKNFLLGATFMNLTERPLTKKINMGDEPISNSIWGLNSSYQVQSRLLTKLVDKLPFVNTKAESNITIESEFANLVPGHNKAIGQSGTAYIDDFEGSKSTIDLKTHYNWKLSSTPTNDFYPYGASDSLSNNYNRSRIAWYVIDPLFYSDNNITPNHIKKDGEQLSNHLVRQVLEKEVFPNKELPNGQPSNLPVLNVSFYPDERGPYNFNTEELNADGKLENPETKWGGIMRSMANVSTDFEATNIEYIEFWMMDPFVNDPEHHGGDIYFHLGDISEDILRDGRKSFENGLPQTDVVQNVDTTVWGRVPNIQALTNSFSQNAEEFQDIGLDGLNDVDEQLFYESYLQEAVAIVTNSSALQAIQEDPSADNYHYFRGSDFDNNATSILERYKRYNLVEGNSVPATKSPESYSTAATSIPDKEDINEDNTLNQAERYFEYKVSLRPENMNIGENYITDKYLATGIPLKNGNTGQVYWYQFRIPVQEYEQTVGNIQDFKSIRFMRMVFKGFSEDVHCRFASFELVRGEWRKISNSLLYPGEYIPNDNNSTSFNIAAVNIEENGKRDPIPYVLPPDIEREENIGSTNLNKLNEQSLSLKVCNLEDGDSRAIYKSTNFDFRRYGKIRMFVHAEKAFESDDLEDGDLTVFVRLGSDFTANYYEYEIPLKLTPWYTSFAAVRTIWPDENQLNLDIQKLIDLKKARNAAVRANPDLGFTNPYVQFDGKNKMTILGTPNLGDVKTIIIGIRNVKQDANNMASDDGQPKCAEIWINELRMTNFDEDGGWAANTRVSANLADLGNVVLAGMHSTAGFGGIEQKINERQKDNITRYDVATNVELGKFLPEKSGIKIPMHFDYSETKKNPEYNPLNPDINLKEDIESYENDDEKKEVMKMVQDYTMQKSINFTNVRKERTGGGNKKRKPQIYDVENLNFTYAYTETFHRDFDIRHNLLKTYDANVGYNFNNNPKNITPFSKNKFLTKTKPLKLVKDFNFYLAPKLISFQNILHREYEENQFRNKMEAIIPITETYIKNFDWNRLYNLKFDLSRGLKLDYNANAGSWIKEPPGTKIEKGEAWKPLFNQLGIDSARFGELTNYSQTININYSVPINKLPMLDWVSLRAQYSGQYAWDRAAPAAQELGNSIFNSNSKKLNATANLANLYKKVGYLKQLDRKSRGKSRNVNRYEAEDEETEDSVKNVQATEILKGVFDNTLRILTGLKNVTYSLNVTNGSQLPGFLNTPSIIGRDWDAKPSAAPGLMYLFGSPFATKHDDTLVYEAAMNGWISRDSNLNSAFATQYMKNHNFKATIEPYKKFKIDLSADWQNSSNRSMYFYVDSVAPGDYRAITNPPVETGNFSMSFISLKTAWFGDNEDNSNEIFRRFLAYRNDISARLGERNPNNDDNLQLVDANGQVAYQDGYGPLSQDVLIPAFLAAYSGQDKNKVSLNPLPDIPLPNWRVTFDGLIDIDFVKKYFKRFSLSHGYRCAYTVGSYGNVIQYEERDDFAYARYENGNFIPEYEIGQVSIREQFNPLFKVDMTWHNSLSTSFELKKARELALSFVNYQLTEIIRNDVVVGVGYRIKDVRFKLGGGSNKKPIKSDLNLKADVAVGRNKTVLRKIIERTHTPSAGQRMVTINTSADYQLSKSLTFRFYFDKIITKPFVSNQYPTSNTNAGISLRFTLVQ